MTGGKGSAAIAVLSWHGYDSLEATLATYSAAGLVGMFDDAIVFLPEGTDRGIRIAEAAGFRPVVSPTNRGILGGIQGEAESVETDAILLLENDCPVIVPKAEAARQIGHARRLLADGAAQVVRLRSLADPGDAYTTAEKYERMYPAPGATEPARVAAAIRRMLRPGKARRYLGLSVLHDQSRAVAAGVCTMDEAGFARTTSGRVPWTNQSVLVDRLLLLKTLIPQAASVSSRRLQNKARNLEIELNDRWWREQEFPIAVAPGVFTHRRLDDRGY